MNCFAAGDEVLLADLGELVDAEGLSDTDPNSWRALPYESERFPGVMLGEGGGSDVSPLTLRVGHEGAYRIHLGLYSGWGFTSVRVRLSGDEEAQTVGVPEELRTGMVHDTSTIIYEAVWKDAELAGQDIVLEGASDTQDFPGALAYIRLEPLDKIGGEPLAKSPPTPEPPERGIDASRQVAFPMAITEDGHGIFGESVHATPEDLVKPFDDIPDGSCLRMLLWGNGEADICNYPTEVGNERAFSGFSTDWYGRWNQNAENWKQDGWDSLKVVTDYAKTRGWELQVYIRMEAFKSPFPFDKMVRSDFFEAHPEYHCQDRYGQRIGRLSYAYPEVQEHMLDLVKEIAGYEPDGICFCFIRGLPVVGYEPIMVEGFKKKHGVDPRELGETDERWLDYQGQVVTAFMRKAKRALKPGQRLSAIVPGNRYDCERWGLDVAAWLKQGVVDGLFPTGQVFSDRDVHLDGPENLDFTYFQGLDGRERIRLMPLLYPWTKFHADYEGWRAYLRGMLDGGADGYVVWDSRGLIPRVGDVGYEQDPAGTDPLYDDPRKLGLKSLQGIRMDRYHHFEVI
ncbi:MAG TPA: family 10 glycosylhydrolase [Armatimonadota bacterium]|nr:family 10 glycosylhydrolase [Armatimonadota bacterium]